MGTVFINLSYVVDDGDDKSAAESAAADDFATLIGKNPYITSASFTSDTTGPINLHDRFANLAAAAPAEHPEETGPAAQGIGEGEEGAGKTAPSRSQKRAAKAARRR